MPEPRKLVLFLLSAGSPTNRGSCIMPAGKAASARHTYLPIFAQMHEMNILVIRRLILLVLGGIPGVLPQILSRSPPRRASLGRLSVVAACPWTCWAIGDVLAVCASAECVLCYCYSFFPRGIA